LITTEAAISDAPEDKAGGMGGGMPGGMGGMGGMGDMGF
jgi:chaperonin GroEL